MSEHRYRLELLREYNEATAALAAKGYIETDDGGVSHTLTSAGFLAGQDKYIDLSPEDKILIRLYVMTMTDFPED